MRFRAGAPRRKAAAKFSASSHDTTHTVGHDGGVENITTMNTARTFDPTHRLDLDLTFTEQVSWCVDRFSCSRQEATHILWECGFRVGTDRATWIREVHALTFLTNYRNAQCFIRINDITD